jgi:hypothetical protein
MTAMPNTGVAEVDRNKAHITAAMPLNRSIR